MWDQYQDDNGDIDLMSDDVSLSNNSTMAQELSFALKEFGFGPNDFDNGAMSQYQEDQQVQNQNTQSNNSGFDSGNGNGVSSVNGMNGFREWHSEDDLPKRMEMTHKIMRLLQERKKEPCHKSWLQELPHKALRLEKHLYKSAPTLEAYMDESTLKHRLRKVANAITSHLRLKKANQMQRKLNSSLPSNWNAQNNEVNQQRRNTSFHPNQQMPNINPPMSQVNPNAENNPTGTTTPNTGIDQTQLLSQMLEMQKTLNNMLKTSSMNGGNITPEQQQLQQQMFIMQNQLNQLNQQSMNPSNYSTMNGNSAAINQSMHMLNNSHMNDSTGTSSNDDELDIEFLQDIF